MNLPFTTEEFLGVFNEYNTAVWPTQILFYILAAVIIYFLFRPTTFSSKIITGILAFFWLWMGVVYHWTYFSPINPVAKVFAIFFAAQGLLLLWHVTKKRVVGYRFEKNISSYVGLTLIGVALVIYPVVGYLAGHSYPYNPTFGVPCPTTIFTFGVLLCATSLPRKLLIIPVLWSLIGFWAAISLGITEDTLLLLAGIVSAVVVNFLKKPESAMASSS